MSQRLNNAICAGFVERATALGLKGKRREDALMDYVAGARAALGLLASPICEDLGTPEQIKRAADHLAAVGVMLLATRGYAEAERMAKGDGVETAGTHGVSPVSLS